VSSRRTDASAVSPVPNYSPSESHILSRGRIKLEADLQEETKVTEHETELKTSLTDDDLRAIGAMVVRHATRHAETLRGTANAKGLAPVTSFKFSVRFSEVEPDSICCVCEQNGTYGIKMCVGTCCDDIS
jgi:hypothetical protein